MPPILYHNNLSPPSRAALLTIRNVDPDEYEVKNIDIYTGEQNTTEYLKINPLHQVPVYVDDDFILTESRAIACYLASSMQKFYPTDLKKRALVDSRLYFDATNSFPVIRDIVRLVLRIGVKKISEERREAIKQLLNTMESFLSESDWFAGDRRRITSENFYDLSILQRLLGQQFLKDVPLDPKIQHKNVKYFKNNKDNSMNIPCFVHQVQFEKRARMFNFRWLFQLNVAFLSEVCIFCRFFIENKGDEITIADFSFLANVATIKAWGVGFDEYPKLSDWLNRCKSLPGYFENLKGAKCLSNKLEKLLGEPLWS